MKNSHSSPLNHFIPAYFLLFFFVNSTFPSLSQEISLFQAPPFIDIADTKQLFIDDYVIESTRSIDFIMNTPYQTGEILIEADLPCEKGGEVNLYCSVLKDKDGKVKIWYDFLRQKSADPYDHDRHVAYAESTDGIHFVKPELGLFSVYGHKKNNVVIPGVIGGSSVWIDPQAAPEHRYKTQAKVYPSGKFHMHSSPDGIRWDLYAEIDPRGPHDTQNIIFWDNVLNKYLVYSRDWSYPYEGSGMKDIRIRSVRRAEIKDFKEIENTGLVMWPDFIDAGKFRDESLNPVDYYGATVFPYPETNSIYIMLAQAFWHWIPDAAFQGTMQPGMRDVRLAVSRNSVNFERIGSRKAFMRPGPSGRFDSRQIWAMPNPIIMGDEIWFYYSGLNWDRSGGIDPEAPEGKRKSGISRAILRLDGFVSAVAPYEGGEIITKPLKFAGNQLEINANTGAGGRIKVEILDESGIPVPGFSAKDAQWLVGNSVRLPVAWMSDKSLESLSGKTVRLRFIMQDCELFAFQFKQRNK